MTIADKHMQLSDNLYTYVRGVVAAFENVQEHGLAKWTDTVGGKTISGGTFRTSGNGFECSDKSDMNYQPVGATDVIPLIKSGSTVEIAYSAGFKEPHENSYSQIIRFDSQYDSQHYVRGFGDIRGACGSYGDFMGVVSYKGWIPFEEKVHLDQLLACNTVSLTFECETATMYANGKYVCKFQVIGGNPSGIQLAKDKIYHSLRIYDKILSWSEIVRNANVDRRMFMHADTERRTV